MAPPTKDRRHQKGVLMAQLNSTSHRIASRRLHRALILLHRASRYIEAASQSADRHHKDELLEFALGLREICIPLFRVAARLEKGGKV